VQAFDIIERGAGDIGQRNLVDEDVDAVEDGQGIAFLAAVAFRAAVVFRAAVAFVASVALGGRIAGAVRPALATGTSTRRAGVS